jgi:hypothetical protein
MVTFLFVAVLAILGFLWPGARAVISARGAVSGGVDCATRLFGADE